MRKRLTYEERSVLAWMDKGETYKQAEHRLNCLWIAGQHPLQLQRQKKEQDG